MSPIAWFVSHCHDYNGRMRYVHLLQKHIGVDIYGDCGTLKCGQTRSMGTKYNADHDPCFSLVNRKYKFYLSFENAICNDYVTEKAYNALKLNTIPVMFGGGSFRDILPPNSYIDALEYPEPEKLADYLYSLIHDSEKFASYFSWRPFYDVVTYSSVPDNCDLCSQLVSGREENGIGKTGRLSILIFFLVNWDFQSIRRFDLIGILELVPRCHVSNFKLKIKFSSLVRSVVSTQNI